MVKEESTTSVAQTLSHINLDKLESGFGKSKATQSILEIMQNQIAYEQAAGMMESMQASRRKAVREEAKAEAMEALQSNALKQTAANPAQTASNMQDTIKTILTPEFLGIYLVRCFSYLCCSCRCSPSPLRS